MQIRPIEFSLQSSIVSIDRHQVRAPGCHVSGVIKSLEKRYGRLQGRTDIDEKPDDYWNDYRTAGFLIERAFRELLSDLNLVRPGELCVDGVHMTPDYLDANEWVLEEWKCTWRSSGWDIEDPKWDSWFMQIKAYCHALGTLRARLRVFFVNGSYKPRVPQMKAWEMEFTERELQENWQMILSHARQEGMLK